MSNSRAGGTVSKKMNKYPDLETYLQIKHSKLYDVIESLAMLGSLRARKGNKMTFLLPDKKVTDQLEKLVDGDTPEEATDIIYSLMIPMSLPDMSAWERAAKGGINNLLYKIIEIDKVGNNQIILKSGAKISPHKGFTSFERRGNFKYDKENPTYSVWELEGAAPTQGPDKPREERTGPKRGKGTRTGGFFGGNDIAGGEGDTKTKIQLITNALETSYLNCVQSGADYDANGDTVYGPAVVRLLQVIEHKGKTDCCEKLGAVMGLCPIAAYYIAVQPYQQNLSCFVDQDCLAEWALAEQRKDGTCCNVGSALRSYAYGNYITKSGNFSKADIYDGNKKNSILEEVKKVRSRALNRIDRSLNTKIVQLYNDNMVLYQNKILGNDAWCKLWSDDIRFHVALGIESMCSEYLDRRSIAQSLVEKMQSYNQGYQQDVQGSLLLSQSIIDNSLFLSKVVGFINSDCFLYVPCATISGGYEADHSPNDMTNYTSMSMSMSGSYEKAFGSPKSYSGGKQGGVEHVVGLEDVKNFLREADEDVRKEVSGFLDNL